MLHRSCLWTWIVWLTILRHASSTAESPPNNLRAQQGERQQQPHPLQPMHRRLYGAESVAVRNEISRLERRMSRYLTGLNPDPNHRVPYENHPYENRQASALRTLTTASSSSTSSNSSSSSSKGASFQPIRIQFETTALDNIRNSTNAAKIDWIKSVILPATAAFWSRTLSVVPVSGNLRISSSQLDSYKYCGDPELTLVPDQDKSTGVANTDLILYVSGSDSSRFCPERTLAVAVPCNFDQFDRPTAGAVNVCLGNIELGSDGTATKEVMDNYIAVTTHEVGHVLGMSSNSYVFFWDPDTGKPRTPRPFTQQTVTCTDGVSRTLSLPAENTLVWGTEYSGAKYAAIVTPKVRAVARNQFDCQSLLGAQLENQDTRPDSCIGDHWDERYFYPESMSAIISPTRNIMSSLTLALLEDSGWYRANYTSTRMSPWGLGVGCDFFQACLLPPSASSTSTTSNSSSSSSSASGTPTIPAYSQGFFCNEGAKKGCSMEHSTKLACTVIDYSYYTPQVLPDTSYQYFPGAPSKGGLRQADYCPVYGTTYNNLDAYQLDCSDPANAPTLNVYSEVYGEGSQCIVSSGGEGLCYKTACVKEDMSIRINVLGNWIKCNSDFESHSIFVGQGLVKTNIICPRLSQACPDLFCPFNCAGRGGCNYTNSFNGTIVPKCECFDQNDTSAGCSDSQIPDGNFLQNSNGLKNNLQQNFFDPLIKVFVDHPSAWTTASWAWASGLIAIFMILLLCICSSVCPQRPRKL